MAGLFDVDDSNVWIEARRWRPWPGGGWLKECRRITTRFAKLAANFLVMIHLAFIERSFRVQSPNGA